MTRVFVLSLFLATILYSQTPQPPPPSPSDKVASLTPLQKEKLLHKRDLRREEAERHQTTDQQILDSQNVIVTEVCRTQLKVPDDKIGTECFVNLTPPTCAGQTEDECLATVTWHKAPPPPTPAPVPAPAPAPAPATPPAN